MLYPLSYESLTCALSSVPGGWSVGPGLDASLPMACAACWEHKYRPHAVH